MEVPSLADWRGRQRIAGWLLAVALVGAPLAIGAQHTVSLVVLASVVAVACALAHWGGPARAPRLAARALVATALFLTVYTGLQAIPLPISVVRILAPETADVWQRALTPLHQPGPEWVTLSLDPIATRIELLRGLLYLGALLTALRIAHAREGAVFLERALVVAGLVMAGAALAHPALGAQRVFGAYKPGETYAYQANHISPLLNVNHLSGFVNVGFFVAVGAGLARRDGSMPRVVALAAAALLLATNLWAGSRGGTLALAVAFVAALAMTRAARKAEGSRALATIAVAAAVMGGVAMFALGFFSEALADLGSRDVSKLQLAKHAFGLVPKYPVFGTGRGAFQSVFPSLGFGRDNWVFTHPENILAQWVTEWGLPVALFAFAVVAYALSPRAVLTRSHAPVGPWAALAAALVHNMVDFHSEIPGVVLSLVVCAALVTAGSSARTEPRPDRATLLVPKLALGLPLLVGAVGALAIPAAPRELYAEQRRFQDHALDPAMTKDRFHELVREAMLRHPADAYFPFTGALRATLARDEPVLPWAGRALERSPVYGRAHLLIARALYRDRPAQARLEYRIAYAQEVNLREAIAQEAPRLVSDYESAMELVPDGPVGVPMLDTLAARLATKLPATSERLDTEALARDENASGALKRRARAALVDLEANAPWCADRRACADAGLGYAKRVRAADPENCEGAVLMADLMAATGDAKGALDEIERALVSAKDTVQCVQALVAIAERSGQRARADAAMAKLERMGCTSTAQCADNLAFLAEVELGRHNVRHAISLYLRAHEQAPEREDFLVAAGDLAEQAELWGEALDVFTKLAARHPAEPKWAEAVARTRAAIQDRAFRPKLVDGDAGAHDPRRP